MKEYRIWASITSFIPKYKYNELVVVLKADTDNNAFYQCEQLLYRRRLAYREDDVNMVIFGDNEQNRKEFEEFEKKGKVVR